MKKVVIFEFQDVRYASRARKEAFSLANNGYDVTLVGFNRSIDKGINVNEKGVKIVAFPIYKLFRDTFLGKIINIIIFNIVLTLYLLKNNFDIYHLHNQKIFFATIITYLIKKKPLIYDAHELHVKKRKGNSVRKKILDRFDKFMEQILIRISFRVIQASDLRADYFAKYYHTTRPLVLENHDNLTNINPEIKGVRERLNLTNNERILIFTGNITIGNNQYIDNVIYSLQYLPRNVHFCVMGRGTDRTINLLHSMAEQMKVEDRFHILSPVLSENVVSTISTADIGVIPIFATSLNSEFSALNKLSQSLMAGLAVAASNYKNLYETIMKNKIGRVGAVFDVTKPQEIANAIKEILKSDLNTLKNNARKLAIQQYNWEAQEDKLLSLYDKIVSQ